MTGLTVSKENMKFISTTLKIQIKLSFGSPGVYGSKGRRNLDVGTGNSANCSALDQLLSL